MTSVTVRIDGWPYRIEFSGTVEVQRLDSGDVAVRRVSDNATVKVELDEERLEESLRLFRSIEERMRTIPGGTTTIHTADDLGIKYTAIDVFSCYDSVMKGRP
jgi:hypothetical protein